MTRSNPRFDPAGWLGALREWIVETTIESRMARLSTLGIQLPPYKEPNTDGWQESMREVDAAGGAGADAGQQDAAGEGRSPANGAAAPGRRQA